MAKKIVDDPHNLLQRLETQIHLMLLEIEEDPERYSFKDRKDLVSCLGMYLNRKYGWDDESASGSGATIKRYSGAFKTTNVAGGGSRGARRPATIATAPDDDPDEAA